MVERGREDKKRICMRTYRNLYAEFISDENIKLAIQNFSKGKKRRNKVRKISTVDRKARCIEYDRIQARRKYAIGQTA